MHTEYRVSETTVVIVAPRRSAPGWETFTVYTDAEDRFTSYHKTHATEDAAQARALRLAAHLIERKSAAPTLTLQQAAAYLAERGYTVGRRRIGGRGSPQPDTLKHWILRGKLGGTKAAKTWFTTVEDLDRLIAEA